jgi:predicted regulator of Ras-like GTPase activity (Roadblock/LC7/MglB family)
MGFREHLEKICSSIDGAIAASVMGFDGISVDTVERAEAEGLDLNSLLVEYANILSQVRSAAGMLQTGGVQELMVSTEKLSTLARPLTPEYFLVVALTPEANVGKARFILRVTAPEVAREF